MVKEVRGGNQFLGNDAAAGLFETVSDKKGEVIHCPGTIIAHLNYC